MLKYEKIGIIIWIIWVCKIQQYDLHISENGLKDTWINNIGIV